MLAARSAVKLDDAETRIRALGVKCRAIKVPTDITDAAQRTRLVETTVAEFAHRRAGQSRRSPTGTSRRSISSRGFMGPGAADEPARIRCDSRWPRYRR